MKPATVVRLAAVAALAWPIAALAADPPDLKGKWVGKTHTIIAGSGAHWPTSAGSFDKPGLYEKDLVIQVNGQQDRRFWGVTTLSGNGEKTDEPFIGELTGRDNGEALLADTDGTFRGEFKGDSFSLCYAHSGARDPKGDVSTVVSCTELKRQR